MIAAFSNTPILQTERLILRAPRPGDEEALIPFAMSARGRWNGGGTDTHLGEAWRMMAKLAGHWVLRGYGMFILQDRATDTPIGMSGPWNPGDWPEPELGWSIWSPGHEGKGFAFEAAMAARDFAFEKLGWTTAVSYIAHDNARSRSLAERLGCTLDTCAKQPFSETPCHVFRHPAPKGVA